MSTTDDSNDLAANAWPGFVDILSAVVIMFVFFVMVTAVALYMHTITYTSKQDIKVDVIKEQVTDDIILTTKIETLTLQREVLQQQVNDLNQEVKKIEAKFKDSEGTQDMEVSEDGMSLIIFYGPNSITLSAEAREKVKEFNRSVLERYGVDNVQLVMSASKNDRSPIESITRRVAVARLMNARNVFLDSELDPESIIVKVEEPLNIKGRYDWAKLEFHVGQ